MFIIGGLILGLIYGFFRGKRLSDVRADRFMYVGSYGLAGFTFGVLLTLFIQLFWN